MRTYQDTLKELEILRIESDNLLNKWKEQIELIGIEHPNSQKLLLKAISSEEKYVNSIRNLPHETFLSNAQHELVKNYETIYGLKLNKMPAGYHLTIPLLLPKKEKESATYIRTILQSFMQEIIGTGNIIEPLNEPITLIFVHEYDRNKKVTEWRDHSNIEINVVEDVLNMYLFKDDTGYYCRHMYLSQAAECNATQIYVLKNKYVQQFLKNFYA